MKSSEAQGTGMAGVNLKTSKAQASEMCWSAYFCYREGYEKQKDSYNCSTQGLFKTPGLEHFRACK